MEAYSMPNIVRIENNEAIEEKYLSLPRVESQKASRALMPLRGQDGMEQALAIIKNHPQTPLIAQNKDRVILDALRKAPKEFLKNEEYMLEAIEKNHNAYEFASKELKNNPKFIAEAIKANPAVYAHLSLEQKLDEQFHEEYKKAMFKSATREAIGDNNYMKMPRQAFDTDCPWDMNEHRNDLKDNILRVLKDPTSQPLESDERMRIGARQAAALENPTLKKQLEATEKDFYTAPDTQELARAIALKQTRLHPGADEFLTKIEQMNPELEREIADRQERYWRREPDKKANEELKMMTPEERQQYHADRLQEKTPMKKLAEAYAIYDRKQRTPRLDNDTELDEKVQKTIKEAEKRLKEQKAREECLDYMKNACKDYIYGLVSDGRISQEDASVCIGLIDGIPSVTRASYTYTNLAQASINDFDNGDFHMTPMEINDLKQAIITTDAQQRAAEEKIHEAEQEATQKIDNSHLLRAHPGVHEEKYHKHSFFG